MSAVQPKHVVSMNHGSAYRDPMEKFCAQKEKTTKAGMFGWLFPELPERKASRQELENLGRHMIETEAESSSPVLDSKIPAGFTFLGQFADHDLTFDTTPLPERNEDPL